MRNLAKWLFIVAVASLIAAPLLQAQDDNETITILHKGHAITIPLQALAGHLQHGDTNLDGSPITQSPPQKKGSFIVTLNGADPKTVSPGGSCTFTVYTYEPGMPIATLVYDESKAHAEQTFASYDPSTGVGYYTITVSNVTGSLDIACTVAFLTE